MATQERLQKIEQEIGFRYPASLASIFEEFVSVLSSEGCRGAFPDARLLLSESEIAAASEGIPPALLPFMRQEQAGWAHIFAFDRDSAPPEFRVIVWADHAVVMDWASFPVFYQWVRDQIAKHDTAA